MKVLNRTEFLNTPAGTIYSVFDKDCVGDLGVLCIKTSPPGAYNGLDFNCQVLNELDTGDLPNGQSYEPDLELYEEVNSPNFTGESNNYPLGFEEIGRDGLFDKDALFCVYTEADRIGMARLMLDGLNVPKP